MVLLMDLADSAGTSAASECDDQSYQSSLSVPGKA